MPGRELAPRGADADVAAAFARIEEQLVDSMMRNLARHRVEEVAEGFEWAQWQALQLQALSEYARRNPRIHGPALARINAKVEQAIRASWEAGGSKAEAEILTAIREGWAPPAGAPGDSPGAPFGGGFLRAPAQRLDALVAATSRDMEDAGHALLRRATDVYRQAVYDAQVYAASGAGTYERAVDMATRDLLARGIDCVEYSNGSRHSAPEYARMAVRTATKRAALAGDGSMRDSWGVHTVIVANNPNGCPECMQFSGHVLVDDVYSGGTAGEARASGFTLLSEAMREGLFHPNCRDTTTTWFPGISPEPVGWTKPQLEAAEEREKLEDAQASAERTGARYDRMARYSLDDGNRRRYAAKADEWEGRRLAAGSAERGDFLGSFGGATRGIREEYGQASDMAALFNSRHGGSLESEGAVAEAMGRENAAAMFAGLEHAFSFIGAAPSSLKLVTSRRMPLGALAQMEARGGDYILRLSARKLRGLPADQVEQVAFHEVAHIAEYRLLDDAQFLREADRLREFQSGARGTLAASVASKRAEKALQDAGIAAEYFPPSGKIRFSGDDEKTLRKLPEYAWDGAAKGTQDSEFIAECIRYVAVHGYGKNKIADVIARAFVKG